MGYVFENGFDLGDAWHVRPHRNQICSAASTYQVEPKVMHVLVCLAEQAGEVISKERLMDQVWPDTVVVDKVLTRAISELRKVFDDDPRDPAFIETIPRVGYRLMMPVSFNYGGDAAPWPVLTLERPSRKAPSQQARPRRALVQRVALVLCMMVLTSLGTWWLVANLDAEGQAGFSEATPLTAYVGHEIQPDLSPDGQRVAFLWAGERQANLDLYVKQPNMDTPLRLTDDGATEQYPIWSSRGESIAFARYEGGACEGIYVMPGLGGARRKLASCQDDLLASSFDWSPDEKWLALSVREASSKTARLLLLNLQTGERRHITNPPASTLGDREPVFSPDGQTLLFQRTLTNYTKDLFLVPVEGGVPRRLTFDYGDLIGHTWTADGEHILFSSDRGGSYNLWRIALDGTGLVEVTPGGWNLKEPTIAKDAGDLAYERWLYDTNIWHLSLPQGRDDGAGAVRVVASSLWDQQPSFAPDGRRIAFVSNRSGTYEVWASNLDGTDPVRLTSFQGPFVGTPSWSPDGRMLAFEGRRDGQAAIYLVEVDGGGLRRFTQIREADYVAPSWSPDGQWVYYGSNRSGAWQVWKQPLDGGEAVQVTRQGGLRALVAHDEHTLYYAKNDEPGIWMTSAASDEEIRVVADLEVYDWGNWDLAAAGLYYVQRATDGTASLHYFQFDSQQITLLASLSCQLSWNRSSLALAPDEQSLLFTQVDRSESDIMLMRNGSLPTP